MKLHHLTGGSRGEVTEIEGPGISIGRELDNDVVLTDGMASRYHAKIDQSDDVWTLHDLGSRNGVLLNGRKIDGTAPLSIRDEVRIGEARFIFTDEDQLPQSVVQDMQGGTPAATGASVAPKADQGTQVQQGSSGAARLVKPLLMALVVVLLVLGAILALPSPPDQDGGNRQPVGELEPGDPVHLQMYFLREIAGQDRLYHYRASLEDGLLELAIKNVHTNYHATPKPIELDEEQLQKLQNALLNGTFRAMSSPPKQSTSGEHQRTVLMVANRRVGNYVEVVNAVAPAGFEELSSRVQDRVAEFFGMPTMPAGKEDRRLEMAEKNFQIARDILQHGERVSPRNLGNAIESLHLVTSLLQWTEPKPDFYERAVEMLRQAEARLDEKVQTLMQDADVLVRQQSQPRLREAREKYRLVREYLHFDEEDERHREARNRILEINRELQR